MALALIFTATATSAETKSGLLKGPIVITSSTLSADAGNNTAVFEGSVVAKTDEMTLQSDKMTAYYTPQGDIERIEAEGNIRLVKGSRVLTARNALYDANEARITFTGEPMAVEGPNVITGSKIIYLVNEDRSIVHDSKVYIEQKGTR